MSQGFDVDTEVLRTMAVKVRRVVCDLSSTALKEPADAGHDWVVDAGAGFSAAWTQGLSARVTDSEDFADRLDETARIFDEGDDAAKAELDALIWGL